MNRKICFTIFNLITLSFSLVIQASDKIAIIDISNVFQQSPQRITVAKQLENEFKARATELQSIENNLQSKMQRLQSDGAIMTPDERNILEKSVITQREIFSNKAQTFEQENRFRQTEERDKILNLIKEKVKNIAKKEGYDVVIDSNAVIYADSIKDITTEVLNQVKQ